MMVIAHTGTRVEFGTGTTAVHIQGRHSVLYGRKSSTKKCYVHTRPAGQGQILGGVGLELEWKTRRTRFCRYLYKWASVQFCRSKDQVGSQAGVPERQMAGPNPQKGPINIPELL